jgi:hypothetical protein
VATYAAPQDIREAVAPDGNVTGTCAELTDDQLQRHIQRGQDLVDATTGFTFDADNAPSLLVGLVIALGSYYATLAYRKGKELSQYHPIQLQYADARQTLTQIKSGLVNTIPDLDADQPAVAAGPSVFQPTGTQGVRMFTLADVGLAVKQGDGGPPTIDPALEAWGII